MENTDFQAGRAQGGDEASLIELYERLAPALYTWARLRFKNAGNITEAEDLVQEVWFRALAGFPRFEQRKPGSFRAWIFTIAAHVYIEFMRLRGRSPAQDAEKMATDIPAEITSITQSCRRRDTLAFLIDKVNALPPDDRRLFIHRGLEGQSAALTAEQLGLSVEAAHKRWQRLRDNLADDPAWTELIGTE